MPHPTEATDRIVIKLPVSIAPQPCSQFEADLERGIERKPRELLLDCSQLELVYSGHIRLMWRARERCEESGVALRLTSLRPDILRVLRLMDLEEFFPFKVSDWSRGFADVIAADGESVREALNRFEGFLKICKMPDRVAMDVRTVFYEVATNILNHAGLDSREVIIVTAVLSEIGTQNEINLKFIDSGVPFDPSSPRPEVVLKEAASSRRTRGYGLAMIAKLADSVIYERFRGVFNVCTTVKQWST
jgi:anti-sigma regulatory factor (Ser/Thr protein kinase)/anti-anti-sigma regulatory factor